jgi:hypothetical protein
MRNNVYDITPKLAEKEIEFISEDVVRRLKDVKRVSIKTAVKEALEDYIERSRRIGR